MFIKFQGNATTVEIYILLQTQKYVALSFDSNSRKKVM